LATALTDEPLAAVYSSPLSRAVDTAHEIAAGHELEVRTEAGLIEMDVGEVDGLRFSEVRDRYPGLLEAWLGADGPAQPMPGGERLADVQERAWQALQAIAGRHGEDTVCAVAHNFVILTVVCKAVGIELANFRRLRHAVAAISLLEFRAGKARLLGLNDTCHLDEDR
jgi:broad specificity phosphatase PhoE